MRSTQENRRERLIIILFNPMEKTTLVHTIFGSPVQFLKFEEPWKLSGRRIIYSREEAGPELLLSSQRNYVNCHSDQTVRYLLDSDKLRRPCVEFNRIFGLCWPEDFVKSIAQMKSFLTAVSLCLAAGVF